MFRDRNLTLVVLARFIARLGGEAAFFIGVWGMAAYRFHGTSGQIALLMAALAGSSMVGSAISGTLVDRYGPRNVLVAAQVFYIPVVLAVPLVTEMSLLIAACGLFGLTTAPIMTATASFAPYLTNDERGIEKANALIEGAGALSFVLGPAMGAVVVKVFSLDAVFYVDAFMTLSGVLLVSTVKTPPFAQSARRHPLKEVAEGLRVTYSFRQIRYYVLMGSLVWFSFGAFGALEPLFYRDVVKTGIETIGWVNSLFGAGIALGAFLLTRAPARWTSARGLCLGVAVVGLGSALYVGTTDLRIIGLGALTWGTIIGAVVPLLRTLMQIDAPEEYVGRVMGTAEVHRSAGEIVPLAIAPGLAALFGVQAVMIGGGLVGTVLALGSFSHAASIDRARSGPARKVTVAEALPSDEPISPIT